MRRAGRPRSSNVVSAMPRSTPKEKAAARVPPPENARPTSMSSSEASVGRPLSATRIAGSASGRLIG
jgi:hypothetical protein